jgi:large subunit ribosomal protein L18
MAQEFNKKFTGTEARPRVSVFRSNAAICAQIINDGTGKTLVSASSKEIKESGKPVEKASLCGKLLAKKAKEKKIEAIVFDRNGYRYHGRVKALAEGMREGGLKF